LEYQKKIPRKTPSPVVAVTGADRDPSTLATP